MFELNLENIPEYGRHPLRQISSSLPHHSNVYKHDVDEMTSRIPEINIHIQNMQTHHNRIIELRQRRQEELSRIWKEYEDQETDALIEYRRAELCLEPLCCHVQPTYNNLCTSTQGRGVMTYMTCELCHKTNVPVSYCSTNMIGGCKSQVAIPFQSQTPFITVNDLGPEFLGTVPSITRVDFPGFDPFK
jgi:hypothetical protein